MSLENNLVTGAPVPLVEVWRGPIVESVHRGHLVAVDGAGETIAELGSPETVTYFRSSSKAFQAIPVVASGAADASGFTEKEIALACGSHSGEPIHVETARSMLGKIGMDESALRCGAHEPFSVEVARELIRKGHEPNVLQNNCSGKHAAMLALAKHLGAPTDTYHEWDNPVQQAVAKVVSQFCDVPIDELKIGIDGCGVPVFGLPVRSIRAGKGRLVSKIGAEGVYTVGVLPCAEWPKGLGLAVKIDDGDDRRARPPAVIEALKQLKVLADDDLAALSEYAPIPITNRPGERVGEVRAAFSLNILNQRVSNHRD
jgi:L-asparaginase II